jgi:peptidoglycan/xylan/chitin deacetylase (PgdA/CDA1 family)
MKKYIKSVIKKGLTTIKWRFMPNGIYCFNYHRIGNSQDTRYDSDIFSCDAATFCSHLTFYKKYFKIITVAELSRIIELNEPIDEKLAVLTFDDGYIDNFEVAYQVLNKHEMTAVFFVPTSYIGSSILPWWDEIAWMIRNTKRDSVLIEPWGNEIKIDRGDMNATIRSILLRVKRMEHITMEEILVKMREFLECHLDVGKAELFMNWNHLKEMQKNGMEIGSHTDSHEILSHIDKTGQVNELKKSKNILQENLKVAVTSFAYPVGTRGTYNEETIDALKECGYKLAFTQLLGVNTRSNLNCLELRRFPIDGNITADKIPQLICLN